MRKTEVTVSKCAEAGSQSGPGKSTPLCQEVLHSAASFPNVDTVMVSALEQKEENNNHTCTA